MNQEQSYRMAATVTSQRELRTLRALEKIAASLDGIHQTLTVLSYKLIEEKYPEDCMETIAEMVVAPPPVEIKEKKS